MPARFRDIVRAANQAREDVTVDPPKSGSHWLFRRKGYRPYPISAHNQSVELNDSIVTKLCACLALDEAAFRKLL